MTEDLTKFECLRNNASVEFAQTMIVIDDEVSQGSPASPVPNGPVGEPTRKTKSIETDPANDTAESISLPLDAETLVDKAMDLQLVCSVLRPKENVRREKENAEFIKRVVNAAEVADIVCLDWSIYGDDGTTASKIIAEIVRKDSEKGGRLRLVAIYTGNKDIYGIYGKILSEISSKIKNDGCIKTQDHEIKSNNGVKIMCLFKKHGVQIHKTLSKYQVSESELPKRLQSEYAQLSEGLLSNVALATISAIRRSTHHVLAKFMGQMDGPYFHHRATIENPEDAEEYAVNVVLSELNGAVDKSRIAKEYAGPDAIEATIQEKAESASKLNLHHNDKNGKEISYELEIDDSIAIIRDGLNPLPKSKSLPPKEVIRKSLTTLFFETQEKARDAMNQFAALTGVCAHPGEYLYKSGKLVAKLGLGSIIQCQTPKKEYLICLQAGCDSVRIGDKGYFMFIPMEESKRVEDFEHVVPLSHDPIKYIVFQASGSLYKKARSIEFKSMDQKTVNAKKDENKNGFFFKDTNDVEYRWIADLKRQRALRIAQRIGQQMGRLGFDEFEPYRQK